MQCHSGGEGGLLRADCPSLRKTQKCKNARQVGYCLNRGRAGKVPAHRVVNSQGYLTGAGSFEHPDMQRMLLEAEGVQVSPDMRVDMGQFGWKNTLEEALTLRARFEREGI